MIKNCRTIEEAKVDIEGNIPYLNENEINYDLNMDIKKEINNDNKNYNFISKTSSKTLKHKKEISKKESLHIDTNNIFDQKTIDHNNVINDIQLLDKLNKTENKRTNNKNDNLELITINKEDLYNSFIYFQQLMSKFDNNNENNKEYIKNRLFEFVSMKKNNYFSETIECNDNYEDNENYNENDNENILDIQNYMQIYCKTEKYENINNTDNNHMNLTKRNSFSYSIYDKNKIFNNYFFTFLNDAKETIKSNSQIFNEYLLIDRNFKDKPISEENSKTFHHNYSFDIKNKEKNELSFQSPDNDKENEKDKYLIIENNDSINDYNNYNSYEKEIKHKSPFENKGYGLLKKNFRKYSTEEDLLIKPFNQNKKDIKIPKNNDEQKEDKFIYRNNNKYSFKENIIISPMKEDKTKLEKINNENAKNNIELPQSLNGLREIKVNKKKTFGYKEQLINEKIKELNDEIIKFKEETNKVTLLKEEYEKMQEKLLKEIKEFNIKKQISLKNFKGSSQSEAKLIMSITQHNQSLIMNNNKKKETIKLLRERIYELENIIKARNNTELTNRKNIFKKINSINNNNNNGDKNFYTSEHYNIFTKKKINYKKKNNDSYVLKKARINLKKKLSNSFEKIKKNKNNNNEIIINQTLNNNINKMIYDNKRLVKSNNNKKVMNASYNHQNIKNTIINSKIPFNNINVNNNIFKKYGFNANSNRNANKKTNLNTNTNIIGLNIPNNLNQRLINNINKVKNDNEVIHTNLNIYEKLINKEREKEKNNKKANININSEREIGHKKVIKEIKTEALDKNKNEKEKKYCSNMHLLENKTTKNKKWQKSHGKNLIMNRLELKTDIFKNKSNINILSSFKNKSKNHSKKKKGINSVRPLIRNTTNTKNKKTEENIKTHMKEINNSLDNKDINKETILNTINDNSDFEDENETDVNNKYDFIIPEKYKNNKGELINTMDTDGKIINIYSSNKKQIIFKSGVIKEIYPDGYQLVYFPNGDMKQKFVGEEEKIIYYYSETNTVQTTFKNGLNVFKFSNGQIEKHYNDGSKFIIYTNGMRKKITKSGKEKLIMPEKQNQQEDNVKNDKEIELNKEKHDNNFISENKKEDKNIKKQRKFNENNNLLLSFLNIEKE